MNPFCRSSCVSPGTLSVTNVLLVHHGQNMLNESASASRCCHCEPCSPESMTSCALRMTRLFPLHIGAHTKVDEEARALGRVLEDGGEELGYLRRGEGGGRGWVG